jgi:hypothetical protein
VAYVEKALVPAPTPEALSTFRKVSTRAQRGETQDQFPWLSAERALLRERAYLSEKRTRANINVFVVLGCGHTHQICGETHWR